MHDLYVIQSLTGLNSVFPSSKPVAIPRLKSCLTIWP